MAFLNQLNYYTPNQRDLLQVTPSRNNHNRAAAPSISNSQLLELSLAQIALPNISNYLINDCRSQQQTIQTLFQTVKLNIHNPKLLVMQDRITKITLLLSEEITPELRRDESISLASEKAVTELERMAEREKELARPRENEMKKGNKFKQFEDEVGELRKDCVRVRTQIESVEGSVKEEDGKWPHGSTRCSQTNPHLQNAHKTQAKQELEISLKAMGELEWRWKKADRQVVEGMRQLQAALSLSEAVSLQPNNLFKNYADSNTHFDNAASTALLATTVYRLANLWGYLKRSGVDRRLTLRPTPACQTMDRLSSTSFKTYGWRGSYTRPTSANKGLEAPNRWRL
ncbi:hypothetical protein JAAARDRAFT_47361 [Jaapia argillacea MUCL 33604]|uniref:Uncharacterized protein n=1 Tax=Jaapia argillacea MUCL 33604 TaxID=933084 RepID=A0A067PWL3_9AGAM|nr:hypothetical protein JAAARDRAFT_47361 [Jaapia argillacea MUCL 33604]